MALIAASRTKLLLASAAVACMSCAAPAAAAKRLHHRTAYTSGVSYDHVPRHSGYQALVSDGVGTGFGFHRLPAPYRFAAAVHRDRQSAAVRSAVITDALTHGGGPYGNALPGDSVYGFGSRATYGVFSGSDGYGSPYFAGWYGPGGGADLGPLGHTYD